MSKFEGRVAVVTGAGKGLGNAYARWLAENGCQVVVNNRTHPGVPSSARLLADEINAGGGIAIAHEGAIDEEASAKALIELAIDHFGKLDILVCNAGVMPIKSFAEADLGEMRRTMDINFWGTVFPLQAAWRHMLRKGYGRIVLSGSASGLFGYGQTVVYGGSRAAPVGLARSLVLETPPDADIKINVILPEAYTPMSGAEFDKTVGKDAAKFLRPELVSPVVGWLCGDDCPFNGAMFHAGVGRVARVAVVQTAAVKLGAQPLETLSSTAFDLGSFIEPTDAEAAGAGLMA
jgi:NAD(P)-dependent dehydrogenase (short-subunit alcohol dehydrogenase family)